MRSAFPGVFRAGVSFVFFLTINSSSSMAADLGGAAESARLQANSPTGWATRALNPNDLPAKDVPKKPAKSAYLAGLEFKALAGTLDRGPSNYFKRLDRRGAVLKSPYISFDNKSDFEGYAAEGFLATFYDNHRVDLVFGGDYIKSTSIFSASFIEDGIKGGHQYLQLSSPVARETVAFKWFRGNQFDLVDINYKNSFSRQEGFVGLRPHLFNRGGRHQTGGLKGYGSQPTATRPRHTVVPLLFFSFGRLKVDEQFTGFTDPAQLSSGAYTRPYIRYGYDNEVESRFYGLGFGLRVQGPLVYGNGIQISYFAKARGAVEFHSYDGSANWFAKNTNGVRSAVLNRTPGHCGLSGINCAAGRSLSGRKTTYSAAIELGLRLGIAAGVFLDVGGRYQGTTAPQVDITGDTDATVNFQRASALGGFVGLSARF